MNLIVTRENGYEQADQYECTWAGICNDGRYDRPSIERFKTRLGKGLQFEPDGTEALLWCKPHCGRKNEIIDDDDLLVAMNHALHKGLNTLIFTIQDLALPQDSKDRKLIVLRPIANVSSYSVYNSSTQATEGYRASTWSGFCGLAN